MFYYRNIFCSKLRARASRYPPAQGRSFPLILPSKNIHLGRYFLELSLRLLRTKREVRQQYPPVFAHDLGRAMLLAYRARQLSTTINAQIVDGQEVFGRHAERTVSQPPLARWTYLHGFTAL